MEISVPWRARLPVARLLQGGSPPLLSPPSPLISFHSLPSIKPVTPAGYGLISVVAEENKTNSEAKPLVQPTGLLPLGSCGMIR